LNNSRLSVEQYKNGILSGDRVVLAKAITLVESALAADQSVASHLLDEVISHTGNSIRIGITGIPGVGKSTFIEALGKKLTSEGKKIAVLTIDPSSQLTRGSILGDKTRMEELAKNPNAFIRPTASGNILGGVGGRTREAMLLCEAAGYQIIIIETVGVGQSEVAVRNMVDFFLLLMLAGAGDELQGIKKGIMEMADGLVITKADGDNIKRATEAQFDYQHALHLYPAKILGWSTKVLTSSAYNGSGIGEVWKMIEKYRDHALTTGYFEDNRQRQNIAWFREHFEQLLKSDYSSHKKMQEKILSLENDISEKRISVQLAAQKLFESYVNVLKQM
jgi:LAO/AO transport system kinase